MGTEEPGTPLKKDPMREVSIVEAMNKAAGFNRELAALINKYSGEEHSNTPDFILAQYIVTCLDAFTAATRAREQWYGEFFAPGKRSEKEIRNSEELKHG